MRYLVREVSQFHFSVFHFLYLTLYFLIFEKNIYKAHNFGCDIINTLFKFQLRI